MRLDSYPWAGDRVPGVVGSVSYRHIHEERRYSTQEPSLSRPTRVFIHHAGMLRLDAEDREEHYEGPKIIDETVQ